MNYSIPTAPKDISNLQQKSPTVEVIALAIASIVQTARQQGKTLADLEAEILQDHCILDLGQRRWLKDLISKTWSRLSDYSEVASN